MAGQRRGAAPTRYQPFVEEQEVGITEHTTPELGGIGGRLKLRPSDFIVEEVHPQRPPPPEPEAEPQWLEFTLHKTLLGTLDAIQELAAELRVPPATFTVAGLKDSHALTTQRVTVRRGALDEQQIRRAADALPRLAVDSFCCVARPLKAGHSSGNRFRLAVRGLLTAAQPTEAVVSAVRQRGFINYYGLQRFGHTGTRNPAVGRAYLARQYSQMVDAILGYPPWGCGSAKETAARTAWVQARNGRLALQLMPPQCSLERHVLAALLRADTSAVHSSGSGGTAAGGLGQQRQEAESRRAILSVPLQTRMLFAYAYFNVLWNKMASERVRRYGLKPVEGDCVIAAPQVGYGRGAVAVEVSEGSAEPEQAEVPRSDPPAPHRTAPDRPAASL